MRCMSLNLRSNANSNPTLSATNLQNLKQLIFATTSYNQFSPYLRFQLGFGSAILTTLL